MTTTDFTWLSRVDAAKRLLMSESTLANYATEGKGPPFWNPSGGARGGRARYSALLCDRWLMGDRRYQGLQTMPEAMEHALSAAMVVSLDPNVDETWDDNGPGWALLALEIQGLMKHA